MTALHLLDAVVPDHPAPILVEPSDHSGDPALSWWTNHTRAVWQSRNPGAKWAEAGVYPLVGTSRLGGWVSLRAETALLAAAFFMQGRKTGLRGTHPSGVGARGTLRIHDRLDLPEHPFFRPGRTFDCRVRHANGSFFDDAACTVRGCAVKFADAADESPLDLMMNSGSQGPLWSTASFLRYTRARVKCDPGAGVFEPQARLMDEVPAYLMSWMESVRVAPDCFSDLTYHAAVVFPFVGCDGVLRYLRYRLRRPDLLRESGMCTEERQATAWDMRRHPDDDRPTHYARAELARRVRTRGVEYLLQVQLRDSASGDDTELFHLNRPWSTRTWPWKDLATITLHEVLDDAETEKMRFSERNQPEGLGVFRAPSAADYRSIGWSRLALYRASALGRGRGPSGPPRNPYQ